MNDILIKIDTKTAKAHCEYNKIGVQHANLQNKLIFEMSEKIIGSAWLEYEINGTKNYAEMEETEKGYQIDIKSCLLISNCVNVDLKITESENANGIPIFVSTIVELDVCESINATEEEPEYYPDWKTVADSKIAEINQLKIDVNAAINETNTLDLDVSKSGKTATVTLTKKDNTTKTVTLSDGTNLMFNWDGTKLGIKTDEDAEYVYVDLQGVQGPIGPKGEAFTIKKTYSSVAEMNADFNNMQLGDYVMIASTVELEDNAKLYTRGEEQWIFISDFSGATGIKGETGATPNIQIGTVTSGSTPSVTRSGTNETPILNFVLVKGDKGDTGQTGATGATGNGIASITKTGTQDTVDTYTILYTDGTTSTFTVTNGEVSQAQLDVVQMEVDKYQTLSKLLPKVEGEGTTVTLNDTVEGVTMDIIPEGNTTQNVTTGKNIFNKVDYTTIDTRNNQSPSGTTKTVNSISFTSNVENNYSGIYITIANLENYIDNFSSDTTYYVSADITTNKACTMYYGTTKNSEELQIGTQRLVKGGTLSSNFVFYVRATEANIKIENIMVSTSDDTTHEVYTGGKEAPSPDYPQAIKVVTGDQNVQVGNINYLLSLGTIELAKIADYQDYICGTPNNWYKYKYVQKVILNGTTSSFTSKSQATANVIWMTDTIYDVPNYIDAMSNYFIKRPRNTAYSNNITGIYLEAQRIKCAFSLETSLTTKELANQWLSTHNVAVYYVLSTPTTEQITDTTLITQLNNLYNATSQEGTTYITCSSASDNNETLQVKVSAYKDISSILNPTESAGD